MAYWSQCQYCGSWAVSAAPLAHIKNKSCPYCGEPLDEKHETEIPDNSDKE
jgi:hypothetical protein